MGKGTGSRETGVIELVMSQRCRGVHAQMIILPYSPRVCAHLCMCMCAADGLAAHVLGEETLRGSTPISRRAAESTHTTSATRSN